MASPIIDPDTLLAKADAHRRERDWLGAADAYRQFTILRPNDWTIIVQEGHCLKEGGKVAEALARYREAEALAPDDADLQVQIGHAQKVLGRWHDAARAYHRALAMNPASAAARVEAAATAEWLTGPEIDAADRAALSRERDTDPRFAPFLPVPQPADATLARCSTSRTCCNTSTIAAPPPASSACNPASSPGP
jgi:tetratricopeptide (TPR) repeat protein